jgi:oligopeptide transport system permease protein
MSEPRKIAKEKFTFVQREGKIFDKEFETKPVGYFQDAMSRFARNKTNVIASGILLTIILFSIFQPLITDKNYVNQESSIAFLPPRIPILENFGIADGKVYFENQPIDLASIDPSTGFAGNPIGYDTQFIVDDTREYGTVACSDRTELCTGGQAVLRLERDSAGLTIESRRAFPLSTSIPSVLAIDVFDLPENGVLNVQARVDGEYVTLQELRSEGITEIDVQAALASLGVTSNLSSPIRLNFQSPGLRDFAAITSVGLYQNNNSTPVIFDTGFPLSQYTRVLIDGELGFYTRQNGEIQVVSFDYDSYGALFGTRTINAMPRSEYDTIIANNPCTIIDNPENPNGWLFSEGCPIEEVLFENPGVIVGGVNFSTYRVDVNYALLNGYEEVPYYYFGTTGAGRDLFSLIWVATRTSLLIGFVAAAINITIGVVFGAISGYYGGNVDILMQRFSEVVGRIPFLVVMAIFIAVFGAGIQTLIFILIVSGWIGIAYTTRAQFYRFKGREYVLASRTLGAKDMRLIFRHILPNGIGTIITASILIIPATIFTESTISYLGFGIGHGQSFNILGFTFSGVSVGVLLADGRPELVTRPHLTTFPAIIISILMITFNMFGNALRDALNPSLRGSL